MAQRELGTVIVTGGGSGLGAAVAQLVEKNGGTPVVFDLQQSPNGYETKIVDITDTAAVTAAVEEVQTTHGAVNGVFTGAGTDACGTLEEVPVDAWERVIKVNLIGTAATVRAAVPALKESKGTVVTVASTLGIKAVSDATAYCASKFGVVGFTRALAAELAGQVGVTLLIPGGMHTHFFDGRTEQYKPGPDAQLNDPEDTANAVIFAMQQPAGCEVREMVVANSMETSWP